LRHIELEGEELPEKNEYLCEKTLLIAFESGILSRTARSHDKYWNKKSLHERSILMLLSTLPDLPGRTYDVIGVVCSAMAPTTNTKNRENMFNDIIQQASGLGADAIVDIKLSHSYPAVIVIGTAVKLR
jgi:Putative heavy-metal-binding